ncbi:MAG: HlyD family efflux transporter periplasmic adaptor subunit [Myxococcales bacterium]|nr:HlyD family efflux transporter periplasmic adaptor subunit [Myxococcales bacterium]
MGRRPQTSPPRDHALVVVVASSAKLAERVRHACRGTDQVVIVDGDAELQNALSTNVRLIVVGDASRGLRGADLVHKLQSHYSRNAHPVPPIVTVGVDLPLGEVFYRAPAQIGDAEFVSIINSALSTRRPPEIALDRDAQRLNQIYQYGRRLADQRDLVAAARLAASAAAALVSGEHAHVWYVDEASGSLWAGGGALQEEENQELSAAHGIAGFAVRVNQALAVTRASDDPRFVSAVDNPMGKRDDRLVAVPVATAGGEVHAVLVVTRHSNAAPFSDGDVGDLRELAHAWAPFLHQQSKELHVKNLVQSEYVNPGGERLFRDEALAAQQFRTATGDVIRVHPGWVKGVFWLIIGGFFAALLFSAIARVHRYAKGPAVIRITGRSEVISTTPGSVAAVRVAPGQRVAAGQLLVQLSNNEQSAAMATIQAEFERNLIVYLQAPNDPGIRQSLSGLVRQRDTAKAALEARQIYAPHDGVVREVLVGEGQLIEPGTVVASLAVPNAPGGARIVAFIPGSERPRLAAGQELRITISGFREADMILKVDRVSNEILGPQEAVRRYLGGRFAEATQIAGPVVVVEGTIATTSFVDSGETFEIPDGMSGLAEIKLKSESMLKTLIVGEK